MIPPRVLASVVLILCSASLAAQSGDSATHEADRAVLRGLLAKVEQALNERDLDAVVPLLHPQVVMTYQNAEVSRGIEAARDFYSRMLIGPDAVVKGFSTHPEVSAPAVFFEKSAVAHGTTREHYTLTEGLEFDLDTRWTATVVDEGDGWKVASLHFSSNLFDNPILAGAQKMLWLAAGAGLVCGAILTLIAVRVLRR